MNGGKSTRSGGSSVGKMGAGVKGVLPLEDKVLGLVHYKEGVGGFLVFSNSFDFTEFCKIDYFECFNSALTKNLKMSCSCFRCFYFKFFKILKMFLMIFQSMRMSVLFAPSLWSLCNPSVLGTRSSISPLNTWRKQGKVVAPTARTVHYNFFYRDVECERG
jgi:hypothetical protein